MQDRRNFLKLTGGLALGSLILPYIAESKTNEDKPNFKTGIQLYSVRENMLKDAAGTLKQLAAIGYKEIESARSDKGNYYGLTPKEIKKICSDLGMTLRSGHVQIDGKWQQSIDMAAEAGQTYLVCSVLPVEIQGIDNYKRAAERFNKAGEECKKAGLIFGYHNHEYEFEKENGQTLYDILLDNTDPKLVQMELDLGWLIVTGNDPATYFKKYPGRFPLWHLKDMNKAKKHSTEFGKGDVDIKGLLDMKAASGMKYFFVEQEEYSTQPLESLKYDYDYINK
ncbi:TIM barrel protein [Pedobacter sp. HMF7647]|uniref:TIM barrel protein n=1 Tax=Hufsiella arboris TaxID=2695275 RepID=A0A7K1Y7Y1_9SPHI|nr:sugar phosphate isomerase/epimerase [Hufsiella arboris]MXV50168.1 TIM barrel protein [Hufsiella arboris]